MLVLSGDNTLHHLPLTVCAFIDCWQSWQQPPWGFDVPRRHFSSQHAHQVPEEHLDKERWEEYYTTYSTNSATAQVVKSNRNSQCDCWVGKWSLLLLTDIFFQMQIVSFSLLIVYIYIYRDYFTIWNNAVFIEWHLGGESNQFIYLFILKCFCCPFVKGTLWSWTLSRKEKR